jgi:hypothetical protein
MTLPDWQDMYQPCIVRAAMALWLPNGQQLGPVSTQFMSLLCALTCHPKIGPCNPLQGLIGGAFLMQWQAMMFIANHEGAPTLPANTSDEARDFLALCWAREPMRRASCESLLQHAFITGAKAQAPRGGIEQPERVHPSIGTFPSPIEEEGHTCQPALEQIRPAGQSARSIHAHVPFLQPCACLPFEETRG